MNIIRKAIISLLPMLAILASCNNFLPTPKTQPTAAMETAIAVVGTAMAETQTAIPKETSTTTQIPLVTPLPTFSPLPSTPSMTPIGISPYEAEHEVIRKVIASYLDQIYYMHNSFQVGGLGDVISSAPDGRLFLKTKLRQLAVDITWERQNFYRYVSYNSTLTYSEIVVFDSAQNARANFTETLYTTYERLIPIDTLLYPKQIEHIIMLRHEQDGWKIIYDVYNDNQPRRSLYAPTPFPKDVLDNLDKELINSSQAQGGAVLPKEGKIYIPSDLAQLERWQEYETMLAEKLMPQYSRDTVLCEWELMDKSEQRINIWAVCMTSVTSADVGNYYFNVATVPAVISINADGAVQSVEFPKYGREYLVDFLRLFPNGAWKKLPDDAWGNLPNVEAMEKHLHWRMNHPTEPPLVVLNATAILTATSTATPTP